jgi:hypothetical protein
VSRRLAYRPIRFLVRAAFFADAERCAGVRRRALVRACFASADFEAAPRPARLSTDVVARDRRADVSLLRFLVVRVAPARLVLARDVLARDVLARDVLARLALARVVPARLALARFAPVFERFAAPVFVLARFPWGGSFTPALRAFDRPMAIACFVERAPCFPSRTWSISSRTNSPACVDGAFPSRASSRARSSVS